MKKIQLLILLLCFAGISLQAQTDKDFIDPSNAVKVKFVKKTLTKNKLPLLKATSSNAISPTVTPKVLGGSYDAGTTSDQINVSPSGAVTYNVPVVIPPGINSVAPAIALNYNGQASEGQAGFGWNISGLSSITRVPQNSYYDGEIGDINFDKKDRYSFDGQRLVIKNGIYGNAGSEYQTASYSNIKIKAFGTSFFGAKFGPAYFIVYHPDGSRAWYGFPNAPGSRLEWPIVKLEDPQGNSILYDYSYDQNILKIRSISYGAKGNTAGMNIVKFSYKKRTRPIQFFKGGVKFQRTSVLSKIESLASNSLYRKYQLNHTPTSLGYDQITSITEFNAQNKSLAPITFNYDSSSDGIQPYESGTDGIEIHPGVDYKKTAMLAGEFNADGKMDMVLYNRTSPNKFFLFTDITKGDSNAIGYEVATGPFKTAIANTYISHTGKILGQQGVTTIAEKRSEITFRTYANAPSGIYKQYDKVWRSAPTYQTDADCDLPYTQTIPQEYISGDFNGDGLTDILAVQKPYSVQKCYFRECNQAQKDAKEECCACNYKPPISDSKLTFIDLDRRANSNFVNSAGKLINDLKATDRILPGDYNGDGKTDLFHFSEGFVQIYTLNELNKIKHIETIVDDKIKMNYPALLGDYNGDGKIDFAVPTANKSKTWKFFINTDDSDDFSFTKDIGVWFGENEVSKDHIFPDDPTGGYNFKLFEYHYTAQDFNGDGKTDILSHHVITPYTSNEYSTERISLHINKLENTNSTPSFEPKGFIERNNFGIQKFGIPIFLDLTLRSNNLEYAYVDRHTIHAFEFKKDHRKDILLRSINNNGLITSITYDQDNELPFGSVYTAGTTSLYPYVDIKQLTGLSLVKELKQTGSGITRAQQFTYYGAVSNAEGLGFLGFSSVNRTNWHGDGVGVLWTGKQYAPNLRGALTKEWVSQVNSSKPYNPISETTNTWYPFLSNSKVLRLSLLKSIAEDNVQGTTITKNLTYNEYGNVTKVKTSHRDGYNELTYSYSNNPSATDQTYHIGRTLEETGVTVLKGDSFKTYQKYTYDNNLLTKLVKRGNGSETKTFTYTYDGFGNMTRKQSPGTGYDRVETFVYDNSGRFMLSSKDHLDLETKFTYNTKTGTITTITDPFGLRTVYKYDGWGREIQNTDHLGQVTRMEYKRVTSGLLKGGFTVSITSGQRKEYIVRNALGWLINKSALGLNNKSIRVSYKYDAAGRIIEESEPHFNTTRPSQWNKTYFDGYGRIIKNVIFNGKEINTSYYGLTVSVNDGTKTVTTTKDTAGNILQVTDPGGTIRYQYYANGTMKMADYDTHKIEVDIDQWGRKTRMQDPSAGVYTYKYNKIGQVTEEVSPKGRTNYSYSSKGMLTAKKMQGDNTAMNMQYGYDSKYRNTSLNAFGNNGQVYKYSYTYDDKNRLTKATEKVLGQQATGNFEKNLAYDNFGRPFIETYKSTNQMDGASSTVKIKNQYNNAGMLTEIRDYNNNHILWKLNSETARGQALEIELGNGFTKTRKYNTNGLLTQIRDIKTVSGNTTTAAYIDYKFHQTRNILTERNNKVFNHKENFRYDDLDRLTRISGAVSLTQLYDKRGRIKSNTDQGIYKYDNSKLYQLEELHLNGSGDNYHRQQKVQQVTYNAYKKPVEIHLESKGRVSFEYGPMMNRTHSYFGNLDEDKDKRTFRKFYSSIMPVEILHHKDDQASRIITYVGGNAYDAPIAHVKDVNTGNTNGYHYIHRDYLGSILGISNTQGSLIEKNHFGAWGALDRQEKASATDSFASQQFFLGRGFTAHEHFKSVDLIHMNGRMYDYVLHRFLSPDNYVQDPYSTQSFNRYGYVWNNPLSLTDPSGEIVFTTAALIAIGVTALATAYIGGAQANGSWNPLKWNWKSGKTWTGIGGGFVVGAVGGTIGVLLAPAIAPALASVGITGGILGGAITAGVSGGVSGGIIGGFMTQLPGGSGNFVQGVKSGFVSGFVGGFVIGGAVGGLTTPKGYNVMTGAAPKPTVSPVSDLKSLGATNLDDGLSLAGEGVPAPKPAATAASSQKPPTLQQVMDQRPSGNLNIQAIDDAAGDFSVYQGLNSSGKVEYVGLTTRQPQIRFNEHLNSIGTGKDLLQYEVIRGASNINKINARIFEQSLINHYGLGKNGGQLLNKINSISSKKWYLYGIKDIN